LGENLGAVALVWASCIFLHLLAMAIGYKGAGWLKFSSKDRVAIAFASSQKTLPIGILLATDPTMFGGAGVPFAVFPMLMYHASQLFIDTTIADRFAKMGDKSSTETAA
jgi:sodium/bile acid cotransporter 7